MGLEENDTPKKLLTVALRNCDPPPTPAIFYKQCRLKIYVLCTAIDPLVA